MFKKILPFFLLALLPYLSYAQTIQAGEYFIDTDPGVGNGISLPVFDPFNDSTLSLSISISALSQGWHMVFIRYANSDGVWSQCEGRYFYVLNATSPVVFAEYFIDSDPGVGNGISLPVFDSFNDSTLSLSISVDSGLSLDTHFLYLRYLDANGIWSHYEGRQFIIETCPDSLSFSTTNISCNGSSNGSATVSVPVGTSPYSYLWSNSATTSQIINLTPQTYTITVTDANSCIMIDSVLITEPAAMSVSVSGMDVSCNGNTNGSASVSVTGGGDQPAVWTKFFPATLLNYGNNGGLQSSNPQPNGWSNGAYAAPIDSGTDFTILYKIRAGNGYNQIMAGYSKNLPSAGAYPDKFFYLDGMAFSAYGGIYLGGSVVDNQLSLLEIKRVSGVITASQDGSPITVETYTGNIYPHVIIYSDSSLVKIEEALVTTGGFSYLWSNGQTTQSITGLSAGTYTITVTSSDSCSAMVSVTISQPAALNTGISAVDASCNGCSDGSAYVSVSGGMSPYTFNWSSGETTDSIFNKPADNYDVTVTDANNCTYSTTAFINQPAPA